MSDWDLVTPPPFISSWSFYCNFEVVNAPGLSATGSLAWGTANRAVYMPITIPFPYTINRMFWQNGSAAGGNHYVGIYGFDGAYIWRGTAAGTGNSLPQFVTPTAPVQISPGTYYLGYSHDSTTANRCYGITTTAIGKRLAGIQEATVNLPTSRPTFATPTMTVLPMIGLTNTATGF